METTNKSSSLHKEALDALQEASNHIQSNDRAWGQGLLTWKLNRRMGKEMTRISSEIFHVLNGWSPPKKSELKENLSSDVDTEDMRDMVVGDYARLSQLEPDYLEKMATKNREKLMPLLARLGEIAKTAEEYDHLSILKQIHDPSFDKTAKEMGVKMRKSKKTAPR